ncbi:arsenate reductase family protein [Zobellia nedashkovskayae]|uniref:arsenate reductase family protein n=1 Tax=Zobellia nedashkovskayae TaxID=2779510 RepID=UPI00188CA7A6|nr:hypothetical protein [Zobellia nedashkovskayae]
MPELATSEYEIVLYYNPSRASAEKTLAYAIGEGLPVRDVDILKNIFTGTQLEELAERLSVPLEGLVNKDYPDFPSEFNDANLSDNDWIKLLRKSPEFIKEPIAIRGHKSIFVETPSDLSRL